MCIRDRDGTVRVFDLQTGVLLTDTTIDPVENQVRTHISPEGNGWAWIEQDDNDSYDATAIHICGPDGIHKTLDPAKLNETYNYYSPLLSTEDGIYFYGCYNGPGSSWLYDVLDSDGNVVVSGLRTCAGYYANSVNGLPEGVFAAVKGFESGWMALTGQWNWSYLPLHLCNINVFVCLYNTITDRNWCKEELYALCIPGAMLALLCPSWLDVPSWWTLINLHSISIHALLVLYPVLLVVRGYRPSARRAPQVLAFLFGSALPIYFLNKPLNTNFYFLNNPYGNVITSAFTRLLGEKYYILGFLPAIAVALCLMYLPWVVADARHKKRK